MTDHNFLFGNVKFQISAPFALQMDARWQRFAAEFEKADHCYNLKYVSEKLALPAPAEYEAEYVQCTRYGGRPCRLYFRGDHRPYALVTEQSDDCWELLLDRELLPWGSSVEHLFSLYGLPHSLLLRGSLLLHGAYVLTKYGAVVFTAPSGTGKTTQAELWRKHRGCPIINGDRVILSLQDGVPMAHSLIHSGSSEDCENVSAPLSAVVSLSQAKENRVTGLTGMDALRALLRGSYLLPEFREDADRLVELAGKLCGAVPVLHLACLPDVSAVEALEDQLAALSCERL